VQVFIEGPGHVPMHMISKIWKSNWSTAMKHRFTHSAHW
jgi:thiamine biosynthesis protein ThiC